MTLPVRWPAAVLAVGAAVLATVTLAQTSAAPVTEERVRAAFAAADVNKDSVIDIDEAVGDVILVFAARDTNKDGFLVMEELKGHDPARFKRADRDGDGKLSMAEVAADRVYDFFLIDVNRDGVVTIQEVLAYEIKVRGPLKK